MRLNDYPQQHKEKLRQGARQATFDIFPLPLAQTRASQTWGALGGPAPELHLSGLLPNTILPLGWAENKQSLTKRAYASGQLQH